MKRGYRIFQREKVKDVLAGLSTYEFVKKYVAGDYFNFSMCTGLSIAYSRNKRKIVEHHSREHYYDLIVFMKSEYILGINFTKQYNYDNLCEKYISKNDIHYLIGEMPIKRFSRMPIVKKVLKLL